MHALMLNGLEITSETSEVTRNAIKDELEGNGWTLEIINLSEFEILACRGCFGCWIKTPGECVIDDSARDITKKMINADLMVYLTPIIFGGYSASLKLQSDRSIGLLHPFFEKVNGEYHHRMRYEKYPSLAGFGILRTPNPEQEAVFKKLIQRNSINLHSHRVQAGVLFDGQELSEIKTTVNEVLSDVGVC